MPKPSWRLLQRRFPNGLGQGLTLWVCLLTILVAPARASDGSAPGIAEVLQRSQLQRMAARWNPRLSSEPDVAVHQAEAWLHSRTEAGSTDSDAVRRLHASFARLLMSEPDARSLPPVQLRVLPADDAGLFAEAVFNQPVVVASEAVGRLPEGERLLMLAHELGHQRLHHWLALRGLYRKHIPGAVRPDTTDPVAARLSADAHQLSQRQELEADAYGYRLVHRMGFGLDTAIGLLTRQGMQRETATHPATRQRIAQLRALHGDLDAQLEMAGAATDNPESLSLVQGQLPSAAAP